MATIKNDSSQFYKQLMDLFVESPDSVIVYDQDSTKILFSNNTFKKVFGDKAVDLSSLISKEDAFAYEVFKEELQKNRQAMFNCHLLLPNTKYLETFLRSYIHADKKEVISYIMDVSSEAKKREEESQKKWIGYFERLFANSKDIMNLFSMTQRKILRWNPQAAIAMGYSKEELSDVPIEKIYPPEELLKLGASFQRLAAEGFSEEKLKIYRKGKDLGDIWIRSFVIQYEPEVLCLVHTIDITEEKEREKALLKETRLAALGEASAALAHEINNSLQSIQFNLYLLKEEKARLPEDCFKRLEKIETNVTHIGSVVRNIQNYTHFSRSGRTNVFISAIIESSKQILEGYVANRQIEIVSEIEQNLHPVSVDPNQIQQILLILMKNAIQSMATCEVRKLSIIASSGDNGTLVLRLKDTGCGIPPEVKKTLFESFVTTKPIGVGLGLGLSVARKLALANKVDMTFVSEVGVGTEFVLTFQPQKMETEGEQNAQSYVLMYVDDKDSLFPSFEDFLASKNITVIRSQSAKEAVKTLVNNHVDLVMCVENMYPVSGHAFLKEAANLYSGPICLVRDTNNPMMAVGTDFEIPKNVDTLDYPCEVGVFANMVSSMMGKIKVEEKV
jgi:PAS domain S-box-containing protein